MENNQPIDLEIEREIQEYKTKNGGNFNNGFFNNFDGFLAGGYRRKWWEKRTVTDENLLKIEGNASPLMKTKNVTDFFRDCDDAVKEAGKSDEDIKKERELYDNRPSAVDYEEASERFANFLLPIYKILRKKGYNHPDLVR